MYTYGLFVRNKHTACTTTTTVVLDDVDTELYRLMAAKAVQINRTEKKSKTWSNNSRQSSTVSAVTDLEHKYEAGSVYDWTLSVVCLWQLLLIVVVCLFQTNSPYMYT